MCLRTKILFLLDPIPNKIQKTQLTVSVGLGPGYSQNKKKEQEHRVRKIAIE